MGFFDERLTRNQDNELAARLRRKGYRIAFSTSRWREAVHLIQKYEPDRAGSQGRGRVRASQRNVPSGEYLLPERIP